MITSNEYYLVEKLKEFGIDTKTIKKIIENFEGWRFYIRKKPSEHARIKALYEDMIKSGVRKADAIKDLSLLFEKSEAAIRVIVKKQKRLLFDE